MFNCAVCHSNDWVRIPDPCDNRSTTTAGVLLDQSIGKSHCRHCGFVARTDGDFVGKTKFYEENYISYYQRPGAVQHDRHRYEIMAQWLRNAIGGAQPKRILDVGCGSGWSMLEMKKLYPSSAIEGIEPSTSNSSAAIEAGFPVHVTRVSSELQMEYPFDLIYAKNVLTHVVDPVDFLRNLKRLLAKDGKIVIITVDGTLPSNEFLWCDHNFSFLPEHVRMLAQAAGLHVETIEKNPDDVTILDKQLIVLTHTAETMTGAQTNLITPARAEALLQGRVHYVQQWKSIRDNLGKRTRNAGRVFNFGASMWTFLLAGNCPEYWANVTQCTVDGHSGRCVGKDVVPFETITFEKNDILVLGTNPRTQQTFASRFANLPCQIVTWGQDLRG